MALIDLLNKVCSWRRPIKIGEDDYGDSLYSDIFPGVDVPCRRQVRVGMNRRQLVQNDLAEFDKKLVTYWMFPTDIKEGDFITFLGSETEKTRDVRDAAGHGHHLEVIAESIQETGEGDGRIG